MEDLNTRKVDQLRAIAYITDKTQSQDQRLHLARREIGLLQSLAHIISARTRTASALLASCGSSLLRRRTAWRS